MDESTVAVEVLCILSISELQASFMEGECFFQICFGPNQTEVPRFYPNFNHFPELGCETAEKWVQGEK